MSMGVVEERMRSTTDIKATWSVELLDESLRHVGLLAEIRAKFWRQKLVNLALISSDIVLALLMWGAALALQKLFGHDAVSIVTFASVVPGTVAWVGLRALLGLYPGYGLDQAEELRRQTYTALAALAITVTFAFALQVGQLVSRLVLILGFLGLMVFAPLLRQIVKQGLRRAGLWGKPVVIFNSGEYGERVTTLLAKDTALGYKPIAVFSSHLNYRQRFRETPDESALAEAMILSQKYGVDTVVFAMPHSRREQLARLVNWASYGFRHITVIPNLEGITNSGVVARDFAGVFGVEIRYNLLNPTVRRTKRALDLAATMVCGILILPFFLAVCLLVRLESRGPVFYNAQRMGRDGKLFSCMKFRTMVPDAEAGLQRILEQDPELREEYSRYHKLCNDPRVTRVGRFLRKTSLDELPQLWNVLRGEMSLVGPRPYLPRESSEIGVTQSEILRVYPGITGLWQVSGRSHTSFSERVEIDAYYVRNWSIWLDLVILARTLHTWLLDRDAY